MNSFKNGFIPVCIGFNLFLKHFQVRIQQKNIYNYQRSQCKKSFSANEYCLRLTSEPQHQVIGEFYEVWERRATDFGGPML